MNSVRAFFRITCGIGLIAIAVHLYSSNQKRLNSGGDYGVTLFGHATSLSPSQAVFIYVGAGLVGVIFIVLGIMSLLKSGNGASCRD